MKARFVYQGRTGANIYGEWVEVTQDNLMHPDPRHVANLKYVQFQGKTRP